MSKTRDTLELLGFERILLAVALLAICLPTSICSQVDAPPSIESVQARLQALKDGSGEPKPTWIDDYEQALAALNRSADVRLNAQRFAAEAAEAPNLIDSLREELTNPPQQAELPPENALSLKELETRFEQAQADLAASRAKLAELDDIAKFRSKRKAEFPEELATAQQRMSAAQETLSVLPVGADNEARRTLLLAQLDEYEATIKSLEMERDAYDARQELLPLRRDRAVRRISQGEKITAALRERVDARRAAEGDAAAKSAGEQVDDIAQRFPQLKELAERTQELAKLRSGEEGLPKRISRAQADLAATAAQLEEVSDRYRAARRRISAGGLTEGMGLLLRRDYEWLPQEAELKIASEAREKQLSEAQLELIVTEEERAAVGDLGTAPDRLLQKLEIEEPSAELRAQAHELLKTQRSSRDAVISDLETLSTVFYEHKELSETLIANSLDYRDFIEKRILWVRSSPPNPMGSALAIPKHGLQIAQAIWTRETLEGLKDHLAKYWNTLIPIGLFLAALLSMRSLLKRKRQEMGELVRSFKTDQYLYTVRAFVQSFLLALPLPLLAWTVGSLFLDSPVELGKAIGVGLQDIAVVWLFLRFLRALTANKGVASVHFRWTVSSVAALRKELRWFEPFALGFGFVVITLDNQGSTAWSDSIGRACFVGAMAALALLAHRLLRKESPLWGISPNANKGLIGKTHRIWSLLGTLLPIVLALLSIAGYYYTALQFELRLRYSIGFAVALAMINALLLRWLFILRRRLAVRQALEAKSRKEQEEESQGATESSTSSLDADKVDIPSIDAQTRQLFKTSITLATVVGLFFIWANVLPALRGLDRVQLLPSLAIVSSEMDAEISIPSPLQTEPANNQANSSPTLPGTSTPAIPTASSNNEEVASDEGASQLGLPAKLTLADVLLALVFIFLTSVAAKNLPALLELAVLQRLPLDGGSRYAVSTIVRYLILIVGVSAVSGALGIGWQKVQWLAAALTFGLAFGLQEIFANFVSGLIILIERPIRVGDIVTVGETEGRVTQLRMRATTILDWNRREYLVPNKEFITGSVINWTLSDPVTRMVIPVGIAYGSDTAKARKLLMEVSKKNSLVLDDPAPSAIFRAFGASSLDFELRIFIGNRDLWPKLIDKMHSQIDEAFRKANIEIAFPQRDIHIRTAKGLSDMRQPTEPPKSGTES